MSRFNKSEALPKHGKKRGKKAAGAEPAQPAEPAAGNNDEGTSGLDDNNEEANNG